MTNEATPREVGLSDAQIAALRERGLLAPSAGGNVVRLLPPLNVSPDELAQSVGIFRAVLAAKA